MPNENIFDVEDLLKYFEAPVLIVSTAVGRGMYYIGEAIRERFANSSKVYHIPIEEFLPQRAITEDVKRYKIISGRFRFLLYLIYKVPIFYYRKYLRERFFTKFDLHKLKKKIEALHVKTVICVSHRAAFWVSSLKRRRKMGFELWDILGEYGKNFGYKYIFWSEMNGFLSPIDKNLIGINFPEKVKFIRINLPARKEFYDIAAIKGDPNKVILVCGFWGQGSMVKVLKLLSEKMPQLKIYAVCGENINLCEKIRESFKNNPNIDVCNIVESLAPLLKECASIITKPGISTILEAQAARRKIFLLKGMPVAEDNNARFAIEHFGAQWFSIERVRNWHKCAETKQA